MEKKYWQSIEEKHPGYKPLEEDDQASLMEVLTNEANEKSSSRRDFLKWCGISFFSATVISACENPVKKAIPYLHHPEVLTPGVASWYASTFADGNRYCSILVKSRDGRPIKIEGNTLSSFTYGGTSAIVQASLLGLYDDGARYKHPQKDNNPIAWGAADAEITAALEAASANGKKSYLVTPTLLSPTTQKLISQFSTRFPSVEVVTWDAISYEAIRQAHMQSFQQGIIPDYHFEKAELIVGFSADFLGTWLAPVTFANRYARTRRLTEGQKTMSHHIHFEAGVSVTGSNADVRVPVKPSAEMQIILALYNEMAALTGNPTAGSVTTDYDVKALAQQIMDNRGKALVVCGHDNTEVQVLVNAINQMAGAYGTTIDGTQPLQSGKGNKAAMAQMLQEMEAGNADVAMFYNVNPLYNYPMAEAFAAAMEKVPVKISFAVATDETSKMCNYILPDNHYLESWNDAMPKTGHYSIMQPVMQPIFNTRQFQSSLMAFMGQDTDFHTYLKESWQMDIYPHAGSEAAFNQFWTDTIQTGVIETSQQDAFTAGSAAGSPQEAAARIRELLSGASAIQFVAYESIAVGDGRYANNPWLQELPDPISKVTWDNFAAVSPRFASEHGIADGDFITINGLELPALIQPGQAPDSISVALGYGRMNAGKSADNTGVNAFKLLAGDVSTNNIDSWEKTGKGGYEFARTQSHHNMEGRAIVRETTLEKYNENPKAGNEIRDYHLKHMNTLYPEREFQGHHWVMMIDLNTCTGCSSCVISCQAENNIPTIGKEQVRNRRIMHWIRIDRYYTGDADNPGIVHQPLTCQHCDHAPCENVCPVAATNHSNEGINQMAYNRCVGTKYCINNCPYKVRRFNWFKFVSNDKFDFHLNSELGRMVLNPDVTVRERGVVEKCSFCIQRIMAAKMEAKIERRQLVDGDVIPACAQACPSNAIVFGDINDVNSRVAKLYKDPRNYHLLEELHTLPAVGYLTRIRNTTT